MSNKLALFTDILAKGGVERVVSYASQGLLTGASGYLFAYDTSRIDFQYEGKLIELGIAPPPYGSVLSEAKSLLKSMLKMRAAKKRFGVSLCISFKEGPNLANVFSGRSKTVITVHEQKTSGIRFKGVMGKAVKLLLRHAYNRADCVVAVSNGVAEDLIDNFGIKADRVRVIYNPCDTDTARRSSDEELEDRYREIFDNPVIISVGRFERPKGQWHLIRAFSSVIKKAGNAQLVLLGEGEDEAYLRKVTQELGMERSVHFLGFQRNPFKFMARARMFVLSSLWEGFGNVILEAMACGLPVIATDCRSGPREILAPRTNGREQIKEPEYAEYGVLVPPLDGLYKRGDADLSHEEQVLGEAMWEMLGNEGLQARYAARSHDRLPDFSLGKFVGDWRSLLAEFQAV